MLGVEAMTAEEKGEGKLAGVETTMSKTVDKMEEIKSEVGGVKLGPLAVQVAKTIAIHAAAIAVIADLMQQPAPQDTSQVAAITETLRKSSEELQSLLDSIKDGKVLAKK